MYTLADGTQVEEDASGNVHVIADKNGAPPPPRDTSIAESFLRDTYSLISAAIRRDFALPPSAPATAPAAKPAAIVSPQLVQLGLYIFGGILIFKLLKKA